MRKWVKKVIKSEGAQDTIARLASLYLRFVYKTTRWTVVGMDTAQKLIPNSAAIACFWHGRMAMIPFMWHWPQKKIVALISGHRDGMTVAKTFKHLNIDYTSGSSNQGGAKAFRNLLEVLQRKDIVGIIPDGPRGPAKVLSEGIIHLAKHSQAPIMPLAYAISRYITFNSWDRFQLPLPFSRGVFIYGDPIYIPADIQEMSSVNDVDSYRLQVEQAITALQDKSDRLLEK